jgi:putative copper export protein
MSNSRKTGAIIALCGGLLSLISFFAFPLIVIGPFSLTAQQIASFSFNSIGYGNSSYKSLGWLWVAALLALVLCLLALVPLLSQDSTVAPPDAPPEYAQAQSSGEAKATAGIIICSIISLIIVFISYAYLSQQGNTSIGLSGASFLGAGFWLYGLGALGGLVGGIIQMQVQTPRQ